jgi:hypothetical protein
MEESIEECLLAVIDTLLSDVNKLVMMQFFIPYSRMVPII